MLLERETLKRLVYKICECEWNNHWGKESKVNQIIQVFYRLLTNPEYEKELMLEITRIPEYYGFKLKEFMEAFFKTENYITHSYWYDFIEIMKEYTAEKNYNYNWHNYKYLIGHNMPIAWMSDFYNDFRGNIINIHFVKEGKYKIIETSKVIDGKVEISYYPVNNYTYCFNTFEACLFGLMFPNYNNAVKALFEKEQELL